MMYYNLLALGTITGVYVFSRKQLKENRVFRILFVCFVAVFVLSKAYYFGIYFMPFRFQIMISPFLSIFLAVVLIDFRNSLVGPTYKHIKNVMVFVFIAFYMLSNFYIVAHSLGFMRYPDENGEKYMFISNRAPKLGIRSGYFSSSLNSMRAFTEGAIVPLNSASAENALGSDRKNRINYTEIENNYIVIWLDDVYEHSSYAPKRFEATLRFNKIYTSNHIRTYRSNE